MAQDEARAFGESVAGVLGGHWGDATSAGTADVSSLWSEAAMGGWFELGTEGALHALIAGSRELGRAACPLPLADAYVAAPLWSDSPEVSKRIASGDLRVASAALAAEADSAAYVETADSATHVLSLPTGAGRAELRPITGREPQPGLAVPAPGGTATACAFRRCTSSAAAPTTSSAA